MWQIHLICRLSSYKHYLRLIIVNWFIFNLEKIQFVLPEMRPSVCNTRLWPVGVTDVCLSFSSSAETRCPDEAGPSGNQLYSHHILDWPCLACFAPLYIKITGLHDNSSDFIWFFFQNADLKKQLHELQAKITALSEKQVCCAHNLLRDWIDISLG